MFERYNFWHWQATIIAAHDASNNRYKDRGEIYTIGGTIRLQPHWDSGYVYWWGKEERLSLKGLFKTTYSTDKEEELLYLKYGTVIIVSGDMRANMNLGKNDDGSFSTLIDIDDWEIDPNQGCMSPLCSFVTSADIKEHEYINKHPADLNCVVCTKETIFVAGKVNRFCETCML